MKLPQGVGPVLRDKQAVSFPHLGPEQGVIRPSFRRVDVEIGRHDIVVAGVDRDVRGHEHASDHAPAWIELAGSTAAAGNSRGRRSVSSQRARAA